MKLKIFILALCFAAFCAAASAQTKTTIGSDGNIKVEKVVFQTEQEVISHFKLKETDKTVEFPKGTFKVYQTPRGTLVCIKPTRAGGYNKTSIPK